LPERLAAVGSTAPAVQEILTLLIRRANHVDHASDVVRAGYRRVVDDWSGVHRTGSL
jgi:hypothetical protein